MSVYVCARAHFGRQDDPLLVSLARKGDLQELAARVGRWPLASLMVLFARCPCVRLHAGLVFWGFVQRALGPFCFSRAALATVLGMPGLL